MSLKPPTGIQVIKKEDKEAFLRAFILQDIESRKSNAAQSDAEYLVVARCWDSPVISAIGGLQNEIARAKVGLRIIVSTINTFETFPLSNKLDALIAVGQVRLITDARLFDVHEQLVLNSKTCWIGDVIRREPTKRDAYEQYWNDDASAVTWSKSAFERIWSLSEKVRRVDHASHTIAEASLERQIAKTGDAGGRQSDVQVGTRH